MLHSPEEVRSYKQPDVNWTWPNEPYRGLNYFTRLDAPLFGQRDVDIENCAAIVGSVMNKVMLLHGRSGTGKSSFLRAGLLPVLEDSGFGCLATADRSLEPLIVRCTADPIRRLHREMLDRLASREKYEYIESAGHGDALKALTSAPADADSHDLRETLLLALANLSKATSRSLLLTIDQGEEVFTAEGLETARDAFFRFIEELCIEPLDVKLIISIRTEYYGQFCDQLRIDPNTRASVSLTSLNQYMLHGLRDPAQIEAAITRPTHKDPIQPYGIPFSHYRFEFDKEVPTQIAADLIRHSGESSTLPIMQIVCRDLHRAARAVVDKPVVVHISLNDYIRLGRVDGRVSAFIENSILEALNVVRRRKAARNIIDRLLRFATAPSSYGVGRSESTKWQELFAGLAARQGGGAPVPARNIIDRLLSFIMTPLRDGVGRSEVTKWQELLAGLVARQEGGVLATLLVDEESVLKEARQRGIPEPISECLDEMSKEKYALLRVSSGGGTCLRQFSLGHDALAPSLFQWKEARSQVLRERRKATRLKIAFAIVLVALAGISYVYAMQSYSLRLQTIRISRAVADADLTPYFRKKILFSLFAVTESKAPFAEQLAHQENVAKLRSELNRAPVIVSKSAAALSISSSGYEVTRLDPSGQIFVDDIRQSKREGQQWQPGQRAEQRGRLVGAVTIRKVTDQSPIGQTAIGYVSGLKYPVVYQGGYISWWNDDKDPLKIAANERDLNSLLPDGFLGGGFAWLEIAAGHIRVAQFTAVPRAMKFLEITFSNNQFKAQSPTSASSPGILPPTLSPNSDKFAFITFNEELKLGDRSDPANPVVLGATQEKRTQQDNQKPKQIEPYLESIGFAHTDAAVIVRNSPSQISVFTQPNVSPTRFPLSNSFQKPSVRPRFGRPIIAAAKFGETWRIAWVVEDGVIVVDERQDGYGQTVRLRPLLPASPLEAILRLEFSDKGELLTAISQNGFQDPMNYRVWNLSQEREHFIDTRSDEQLTVEACAIAQLASGSNQFSKQELELVPQQRYQQPCKE